MPGTGADFWRTASFPTNRARLRPGKTNASHRKLEVTSVTLRSLALLLRSALSAVGMTSGTHMHSSFENMIETWQNPSTYKEQHSQNRKKILLFQSMFMGHRHVQNYLHLLHKTTSWEIYRSSKILSNIVSGKNRRQRWEICHSKEADLKLSVLIRTLCTSW